MAQVLRAEAFPGRRSGAPPGAGDAPYSLETAYGYRLDLGFLGYVEAIEKGLTLRRVPVGRRPHRASWAASAEALGPPDPRVERTLRGARRRLEEEEGVPAGILPAAGLPVTVGSPGAAPLRLVREQMAAALGRLRELEEQVRALPALRRRLERLQEEKRQLLDRLRRGGGCRCGCGCASVDGNGDPGGFSDDDGGGGTDDGTGSGTAGSIAGTSISSGIGTSIGAGTVGSSVAGSVAGTTVPASGSGIATGSGTTVPVPATATGPRGRRSVGVGTEGPGVPGGAGGLPGRVAVLERQLRRALGELREARARLAQRQPQPGNEEEEEEGDEDHGRPRGGGSGRPGSSSSDESEYHEAVEAPPPPAGPPPAPQPGRPQAPLSLPPPGPRGDAA